MSILWAEDIGEQMELIQECLHEINPDIHVLPAVNGLELLNLLADCDFLGSLPDLIVLDLNMPVMEGRQVLVELKKDQKYAKIPTVLFSCSNAMIDRMFGKYYHAPLFSKSMEKENCLKSIRQILEWRGIQG